MIGSGRSGTTISSQLLASHPDLAWFSGYSSRYPGHPSVAVASRLTDLSPQRSWRWWPKPSEATGVWNHYFPGFKNASRDLHAADVDPVAAASFRADLDAHARFQGKPRFFTKITGWPRVSFLRAVLPDAYLLQVERDPRAVTMSMHAQNWGGKRRHPERFEGVDLVQFYADLYLQFYDARAAHDWAGVVQLRYESLVDDPGQTMHELCAALDLEDSPRFRRRWSGPTLRAGRQWGDLLDPDDRTRLTSLLERPIIELGYEPDAR